MVPDLTGQQFGKYRLIRLLGSGGFASVYLGQHILLSSQQAAIKILHLQGVDIQRFQAEAETTAKLLHPHIVRLFDFDFQQDTPYLVLDYATQGSLAGRHSHGQKVPLATIVSYLTQITQALQFAHDQHVVHRDLKPDNILVGRQGELLLSDFGIAVLSQTGRTSIGSAYGNAGTAYYMAPEMFRGKPEKASDQYSLAVIAYEWLCGQWPFFEGDFMQLGYQHGFEPVPSLRQHVSTLPIRVEEVILKALSKQPQERFPSVRAFVQALEEASQPTTRPYSGPPAYSAQPSYPPVQSANPYAQPTQICSNCGSQVANNLRFCPTCWTTMPQSANPYSAQPGYPPVQSTFPPPRSYSAQPGYPPVQSANPYAQPTQKCSSCGFPVANNLRFCPICMPEFQAVGSMRLGFLRIEAGKEPGRIYEIRKEDFSIGRSLESDLFLEDLSVSRLHASVLNQGNGHYALRDEGSATGTRVNGLPVNRYRSYPLQEGDRIQLGQTVLAFGGRR